MQCANCDGLFTEFTKAGECPICKSPFKPKAVVVPTIPSIDLNVADSGTSSVQPMSTTVADHNVGKNQPFEYDPTTGRPNIILKNEKGEVVQVLPAFGMVVNGDEEEESGVVEFSGGAKRSTRKAPAFLVMKELIEEVAWTRYEGDNKYAPGNWMQGDKEFFVDCLNHAIEHLYDMPFDDAEDEYTHLGHAACNIGFILWALRRGVITREDFQNAAKILKPRS